LIPINIPEPMASKRATAENFPAMPSTINTILKPIIKTEKLKSFYELTQI
jgi:hypothetical protein